MLPRRQRGRVAGAADSMSAILMVTLLLGIGGALGQGLDQITIGLIPSWHRLVANASLSVPDGVTKRFVNVYKERTITVYDRMKEVAENIKKKKIDAVIGPFDTSVALATENSGVPYLATTPVTKSNLNHTVQLIPRLEDFCQALLKYAQRTGWRKISVFYDDDTGLTLLEHLMSDHTLSVKAWRLPDPERSNTTHMQFKARAALVKMRKVLVKHSIVFCSKTNTKYVMEEARNLAMLSTPPYEWAFYDPGDIMGDLFLIYRDIAVNFTVFTLLPYNNSNSNSSHSNSSEVKVHTHKLEHALAFDAVKLLTAAINGSKEDIITNIKNNRETGRTGSLEMGADGKRSNFVIHLTSNAGPFSYPLGNWSNLTDLNMFKSVNHNRSFVFPLKGRTVRAVMILEQPFTRYKRDAGSRIGNDKFEGFAVDLLEKVAEDLDFRYEIYLVPDKKFGSLKDGEWNGMIQELLEGNAAMSVAPLSINAQREAAVDFTKPFMTRYISVLLKIPRRETSYFEFLNPLSPNVWICTLAAFVVVSFVLYVLERIGSSKSRTGTKISVRESFWFIFGSLLQGNTDATPSTIPGRILTSSWWFFALILISSYTANLAAFLTVKKINTPIKSVTDLAQQTKIKYGTVRDSGVESFFKGTNIEHFSKMWAQMDEIDPDSMVLNASVGYEKVKQGGYAFFWDTTVNKYKTITDCEMMEIDPPFDPKGFGIGVPPGATYLDEVSMAILKLSDRGVLHQLETKWWGSRNCPELDNASQDETSELQIENVAGVFFILVGGILIAAIVCLGEYWAKCLINSQKKKDKKQLPIAKEKASFL